ncbi:hypothetical protein FHS27_006546 [Rhodopirellula rubra]|uniref:Uncharacterized protein n=1 Tax=Aporhodopirellula rubra TaxID=980271 RepID=A0A7W5H9M4_9BACT|nr:hypothetical protein [Aporhodopirellula rubra]MBB3210698.1 hypothetical protein [Aporhodopirellula rubra]
MLSYRDRRVSHRNHFYERQIDAYTEVINSLDGLYDQVQNYIHAHNFVLDSSSRTQLRAEMAQGTFQEQYRNYFATRRKWSLYLPQDFLDSLNDFMNVLNGISAPDEVADQYPDELVYHRDPAMPLSEAYRDVVAVARHGLGVEALSKDMARVFGNRSPDRILDTKLVAEREKGS